jgi:hypothetical protein
MASDKLFYTIAGLQAPRLAADRTRFAERTQLQAVLGEARTFCKR